MTQFNQGNGRHIEEQFRSKPPRIPRLVAYQTKGQLPLTVMALVIILAVVFVYWWIIA